MPQGNIDTPNGGDLDADARRFCAERGWAMPDGSYPIRPLEMHGRSDLQNAIGAVGRGSGSHEAIRQHIMKRARALGLMDMIPDNWTGGGSRSNALGDIPRLAEVEHRHSTVSDVNTRQRIIDIIAVPYEQESDVAWRGDMWHESFDRKAFAGVESHAGRVQVNREHVKGDTVGKVIAADPSHKDGLFARVKIYSTTRGDETLTLADEGGAFPSIGFRVNSFADQRIDKRSKTRRILRAFWDHQAFVEDPAYVGAGVLAVRAGQSGLVVAERPLPKTPALDEWQNDPTFKWASDRTSR